MGFNTCVCWHNQAQLFTVVAVSYTHLPCPETVPMLEDLYNALLTQDEPEAHHVAAALEIYVKGSLNIFNHRTNVEDVYKRQAKSIEEIKSFLSRQKEVYKIPYETHPADRPRQCVFGGTSNALDFLPLDRSGNRRFIPVMVYPEQAEVHILEDEAASRAYIEQMWAEAMEIYRSGRFKPAFSPAMQRYLKEHQRDFMPEDTNAGMIQAYLDKYTGSMVCSKQLYKEALNHTFDEPKQWEIREINEIMNQCISSWRYFPNPRMFSEYGRQKGWERENPATDLLSLIHICISFSLRYEMESTSKWKYTFACNVKW